MAAAASNTVQDETTDLVIRLSTADDADFVVASFDAAVAYLVKKGLKDQWGSTPLSVSRGERFLNKVQALVSNEPRSGDAYARGYIAQLNGKPVGFMAVSNSRPDYLPKAEGEEDEHYVDALISGAPGTSPSASQTRSELGTRLLARAYEDAKRLGISWLRLDCWRGEGVSENGRPRDGLVRYYERHGFQRGRMFEVLPDNKKKIALGDVSVVAEKDAADALEIDGAKENENEAEGEKTWEEKPWPGWLMQKRVV